MKKVKNFARYWTLIKNIPGDHNGLKESHVKTFTRGRTASLHEMSREEYNRMCESLQAVLSSGQQQKAPTAQPPRMTQDEHTAQIKKARSAVLKRMQQLGVDTSDWAEVDNFCMNPRIAGKVFRALSLDECKALIPKLAAIARKPRPVEPTVEVWTYDMCNRFPGNQNVN